MIEATIVSDSIGHDTGVRLTTFRVRYPKFIHGELMTHRRFSRNASSSRAIPTAKLIEECRADWLRAGPEEWGKNQKGMQAGEQLDPVEMLKAKDVWRSAALSAADHAEQMAKLGVHKQIANRLIEPFTHINVVVSSTEWMNWFGLRLHRDAQPEARVLAEAMWPHYVAYRNDKSKAPIPREHGDWHLPFVEDHHRNGLPIDVQIKISVARCARTSYLSFETQKESTVAEDVALYDRLLGSSPIHASPAEHQARPATSDDDIYFTGNFHGWVQYRKLIPGESMAPLPEEYR